MATGNKSFRYFILGLLARQSMSGYDIRRVMKSLGWLVGSPSFGAIYPALHALLGGELVTMEVRSLEDRPLRKIYTITENGRQALQDWVSQPAPPSGNLRAFVMRLILMGDLSTDGLADHLQQRREVIAAHHAALEQTAQDPGLRAGMGHQLAMDYGLATAKAELDWLDGAIAQYREAATPVALRQIWKF